MHLYWRTEISKQTPNPSHPTSVSRVKAGPWTLMNMIASNDEPDKQGIITTVNIGEKDQAKSNKYPNHAPENNR